MKVLTYHSIGIPPKEARLKTLYVNPKAFERQIWLLKTLGFRFLRLSEVLSGNFSGKSVLLTFDDAYSDFFENAYPVLKRYNIPAVVFVPVMCVGKFNLWDWKELRVKKPIMSWDQIKMLVEEGFEIGSHTLTHPFLSRIPPEQAAREIEDSKKILEDKLGVEVVSFCYPYGDYNNMVRDMVARAGYRIAFTTKKGSFEDSPNIYEVRRITIFGNDLLPKFFLKCL
ncbi:polysaccharide deacetylase family protein [Thermocrinis minervae]|uniref:Polysaccharide deacetylase n=1 Tax=Thermocrinis minervae TaxID=381751 RepID=A0A1M6RM79_9AQUI|nr:polysaccharide deacetylase family protein [Thermocrinis minervae]SHK33458.1 Polysaccharide deacetylase [Thermocrinis minervae]